MADTSKSKAQKTTPSRPSRTRAARIAVAPRQLHPQVKVLREYIDSQAIDDPFKKEYGTGTANGPSAIIQPPYSPVALARLPNENDMLSQCIDAMVTNIVGHGWRLEYIGNSDKSLDDEDVQAEKARLEGLIERPNTEMTWRELSEAFWTDYETLGYCYLEQSRDQKGRIVMVSHLPATSMRLTERDVEEVDYTVRLPRDGAYEDVKTKKRFRRYVQQVGTQKVYFKEAGDPRSIDPSDGKENTSLSIEEQATEVIYFRRYNSRSAYGTPRWLPQLPSILGSRQAELTNLDFFNENAIPAMAVIVSGGFITDESLNQIEQVLTAARGRDAANRVVIMEAEGDPDAADEHGKIPPPKVEFKPLAGDRQSDGNFLEYIEACGNSIRSGFRLAPLFVGRSQEMTHATAKTSFEVAESQVFGPDRSKYDDFVNLHILSSWEPKHWAFKSQPAQITDPAEVVKALEVFDGMGAMTPNIAIGLANAYFGLDIPEINEDWGKFPFAIVKDLAAKGALENLDTVSENIAGSGLSDAVDTENEGDQETGEADDTEDAAKEAKILRAFVVRNVDRLNELTQTSDQHAA